METAAILDRLLNAGFEVCTRLLDGTYQVRLVRVTKVTVMAEAGRLHAAMAEAAAQAGLTLDG